MILTIINFIIFFCIYVLIFALQSKTLAEQMAAKLNNKLNYQPKEDDEVSIIGAGTESTFKKYEEELEINDFPQQARWKVTSKVGLLLAIFSFLRGL